VRTLCEIFETWFPPSKTPLRTAIRRQVRCKRAHERVRSSHMCPLQFNSIFFLSSMRVVRFHGLSLLGAWGVVTLLCNISFVSKSTLFPSQPDALSPWDPEVSCPSDRWTVDAFKIKSRKTDDDDAAWGVRHPGTGVHRLWICTFHVNDQRDSRLGTL
jgi:hypothetical protein